MDTQQFLLLMNFARICLMVGSIWWLMQTRASRERIVTVMLSVCMFMLGSNLINATLVVAVLKVTLW